jgi:hypothetical protein
MTAPVTAMTQRSPKSGPKGRKAKGKKANPVRRRIAPKTSKTAACLDLLVRPEGATLAELQQATGWQPHSVRGFLAGTIKKMPGLSLVSEKSEEGPRRYRVQRIAG